MTVRLQKILAWAGAVPAALVVLAMLILLVTDYARMIAHETQNLETLEALELAAAENLERLPELEAERERQTTNAHRRLERQEIETRALIVGAIVLLACAAWLRSLYPARPPAVEALRLRRAHAIGEVTATPGARRARTRTPTNGNGTRSFPVSDNAPLDLGFVDELVARVGREREHAIPLLHAIQSQYGFLPPEALKKVCELTDVTPAQIVGVSTFYAQFRHKPRGRHLLRVCLGTACHVARGGEIAEEMRRHLGMAPDADTDASRLVTLDTVACLGCCSLAPVVTVDGDPLGKLTPVDACEVLDSLRQESHAP